VQLGRDGRLKDSAFSAASSRLAEFKEDIQIARSEFWESKAATQNDDDHRHRMLENFLAAAALILLIIAGNWILSTLVKMP
jgi:hypothetical protein